VEFSLT